MNLRHGQIRRSLPILTVGACLAGGLVLAQTAPTSPARPATSKWRTGGTDRLTATEGALFAKARPSTLRILQCPVNNCADPDGIGTAFLIGDGGLALTAYHVIFQAKALSAQTVDGKNYAVAVVGYDDQNDVALLRVNVPRGTPYLPVAATSPRVGDPVLAIGNGGGSFLTPKTGRLTALDTPSERADFPSGTLELTALLSPGDSGGPILNARGEVTGVVSYISVKSRSGDGPGADPEITAYAVPVTAGGQRLSDLRKGVKREAPVIGVSLGGNFTVFTDLPEAEFAAANRRWGLGLGSVAGAFFTGVAANTPAARAGLRPVRYNAQGQVTQGDLVTAIDGKRVVNFSNFQRVVRTGYRPGDTVTLRVLRAGRTTEVKMTLVGRSAVAGR
ncbi:S1C family serine protease [Deinococcus petrolearius]|uniref:S1C family serine protease n=1 Tax=Deinococcus petrolearius TaxID=1751295 RepID=A0ABW1DPN9_9DEIO